MHCLLSQESCLRIRIDLKQAAITQLHSRIASKFSALQTDASAAVPWSCRQEDLSTRVL